MKVTSIQCKGFKAFENESFQFDDRVYISGDNYQGKTSVAEAITFGLFGSTLYGSPYTDLLINKGSKQAEVTITFDVNGETHEIVRVKGKKSELYLDGQKASQTDVDKLIGEKEHFLSVFVPGYFTALADKDGREMLVRLINPPTKEEVLAKLTDGEQKLLQHERLLDPEGLAKEKRSEIKSAEAEFNKVTGQIEEIEKRLQREIPQPEKFDDAELTNAKQELSSLVSGASGERTTIQTKLQGFRREYDTLLSQLKQVPTEPYKDGDPCPVCARGFDADALDNALAHHHQQANEINTKNEAIKAKAKQLIEEGESLKSKLAGLESESIDTDQMHHLQTKINHLEAKRSEVMAHNAYINRLRMEMADDKEAVDKANATLQELKQEQFTLQETVKAIGAYRAALAEMQVEQLKQHLNRVSIDLFEVTKTTGEIKPCFTIKYDGKEFKSLSYSERIRCNLEFANLFNAIIGMDYPVYIDNAESITHFDNPTASQLFIATVVPGKELTVESDAEKGAVA